ncbi:uncharacterized protein LOC133190740 [Saccostrea echinata]|uniref:uncharacterized protein LOC133190740 n=1 Tax=Saccostrea echinata TaxID=191078 RepID=UPI002A823637|nr:uncharacterized protein LOC133190740 [Saccostrea echinata]
MEVDLDNNTIQPIQPVNIRLPTYSRQSSPSPLRLSRHNAEEQPHFGTSPLRTLRDRASRPYPTRRQVKRTNPPHLQTLHRSAPQLTSVQSKMTKSPTKPAQKTSIPQSQIPSPYVTRSSIQCPSPLVNLQQNPKYLTRSQVKLGKQRKDDHCVLHGKLVLRKEKPKAPNFQSTPKIPRSQLVNKLVSQATDAKPKQSLSKLLAQSKCRTPKRGKNSSNTHDLSTGAKRCITTDNSPAKSKRGKSSAAKSKRGKSNATKIKCELKDADIKKTKQGGIMTRMRNLASSIQQRFSKKRKQGQQDLDTANSSTCDAPLEVVDSEQKRVRFAGTTEAMDTSLPVTCFGSYKVKITKKPLKSDGKQTKKVTIAFPRKSKQLDTKSTISRANPMTSTQQKSTSVKTTAYCCETKEHTMDANVSAPGEKSSQTTADLISDRPVSPTANIKSTLPQSSKKTKSTPAPTSTPKEGLVSVTTNLKTPSKAAMKRSNNFKILSPSPMISLPNATSQTSTEALGTSPKVSTIRKGEPMSISSPPSKDFESTTTLPSMSAEECSKFTAETSLCSKQTASTSSKEAISLLPVNRGVVPSTELQVQDIATTKPQSAGNVAENSSEMSLSTRASLLTSSLEMLQPVPTMAGANISSSTTVASKPVPPELLALNLMPSQSMVSAQPDQGSSATVPLAVSPSDFHQAESYLQKTDSQGKHPAMNPVNQCQIIDPSTKHQAIKDIGKDLPQISTQLPVISSASAMSTTQQQIDFTVKNVQNVDPVFRGLFTQAASTSVLHPVSSSLPTMIASCHMNNYMAGTNGIMPSALTQRMTYTTPAENVMSTMAEPSFNKPSCLYEGAAFTRLNPSMAIQELTRPLSIMIPDYNPTYRMNNYNSSLYKHFGTFHSSYIQYGTANPVMTQTALPRFQQEQPNISTWYSNLQSCPEDLLMQRKVHEERAFGPPDLMCHETLEDNDEVCQATRKELMTQTALSIPSEISLPVLSMDDLVDGGIALSSSSSKAASSQETSGIVKEWSASSHLDSSKDQTLSSLCSQPSVSQLQRKPTQHGKKTKLVIPSIRSNQTETNLNMDMCSIEGLLQVPKSKKRLFTDDATWPERKRQRTSPRKLPQSTSIKRAPSPQPAWTENCSDCIHVERILGDRPYTLLNNVNSLVFSSKSTKEIINEYYDSPIFYRSRGKPHLVARDLVWRLFSVLELYGNRFNTLDSSITDAIHLSVLDKTQCSEQTWRRKCISFVNRSIQHFFRVHFRRFEAYLKHRCDPSLC